MAAETSVFFHSQLIFGESLDSYKTNVLPLHNSFFDGYVFSMKLWRVELKILNIVPLSEKTISNQGITILLHSNKQVANGFACKRLIVDSLHKL